MDTFEYKKLGYNEDDVKSVELSVENSKLSGSITLQGGNIIPIPETDLSSIGYTLPVATLYTLGGVKVAPKQVEQTEYVGIGSDNGLVTRPITKVTGVTGTLSNGILTIEISLDNNSSVSGTVDLKNLLNVEMIEISGVPNKTSLTAAVCNKIKNALDAEKLPVLIWHQNNGTEHVYVVMSYAWDDTPDQELAEMYISYSTGYYYCSGVENPTTNGFDSVMAATYLDNKSYVPTGLLPTATSQQLGMIKGQTGSTDGQSFPVQVNSDGTAFVNIPIYNEEAE